MNELTFYQDCLVPRISESWWQRKICYVVYWKTFGETLIIFMAISLLIFCALIFLLKKLDSKSKFIVASIYWITIILLIKIIIGL